MRLRTQELEYLLTRLARLESLLLAGESAKLGDLRAITLSSKEDFLEELNAIKDEADQVELPKVLIEPAIALGDSAYLLIEAINKGTIEVLEDEPKISEADDVILSLYRKKEGGDVRKVVLSTNELIDAVDYFKKAHELIKGPARRLKVDIATHLSTEIIDT